MRLTRLKPTRRFSNRVEYYAASRPRYPAAILEFLRKAIGLKENQTVVDVGCGTGILSELFLKNGNTVYGVEPNAEMRKVACSLQATYPGFHAVDGTAERSGLGARVADVITAGQAFHWFDAKLTRREFVRISKSGGWVLLLWNERLSDADGFQRDYEELLQTYGKNYDLIDHRNIHVEDFHDFFYPGYYRLKTFPNLQLLDFNGLKSRLISSSYMPVEGQRGFAEMMNALRCLFHANEQDNRVILKYQTQLYYGRLEQKKPGRARPGQGTFR